MLPLLAVGWTVTVEPLAAVAACGEPRPGEAVIAEETLAFPPDAADPDHLDAYDPRAFVVGVDGTPTARLVCLTGRAGRLQVRIEGQGDPAALAVRLAEIAEEAWIEPPHPARATLTDAQVHGRYARPETPAVFDQADHAVSLRVSARKFRREGLGYYLGVDLEGGVGRRGAVIEMTYGVGASVRSGTNALGAGVTVGFAGIGPGRVPVGYEGAFELVAVGDVGPARITLSGRIVNVGLERDAARQRGAPGLPFGDELVVATAVRFGRTMSEEPTYALRDDWGYSVGFVYKAQMGDRWYGVVVGGAWTGAR